MHVHPKLQTGTTFIHSPSPEGRGGIVYFPNANDDFDFEIFKEPVQKLNPKIVYYMYSGLSDRGDANGGRDLAEFIKWCRNRGIVTIVDGHTLTGNPKELIRRGGAIEQYHLLEPLLPELDIFFTSCDEAKLIENTLSEGRKWNDFEEHENLAHILDFLTGKFWNKDQRTRIFGVTVSDGAYEKHIGPDGKISGPNRVKSCFMGGQVVDLVGAGDSFRAGLITYIASNLSLFKSGRLNFEEAMQMGNLFASLFIKAPVSNRYADIKTYDVLLKTIRSV
jgi:sugar/nucleoside kinase (ribokinase family)